MRLDRLLNAAKRTVAIEDSEATVLCYSNPFNPPPNTAP